jgi:hypothetical protein
LRLRASAVKHISFPADGADIDVGLPFILADSGMKHASLRRHLALSGRREEDNPSRQDPITRPVHKVLIVDDERLVGHTRVIFFRVPGMMLVLHRPLEKHWNWSPTGVRTWAILDVVLPKMKRY